MERSLSRLTSLLILLAALAMTSACNTQPAAASSGTGQPSSVSARSNAEDIRAWAAVVIPSAALILGFATLMYNANAQWLLKQHDMVSGYQLRFGGIIEAINKEIDAGHPKAEDIFLRFWGLQEEQFIVWIAGLLPRDTYRSWLRYRVNESRGQMRRFKCPGTSYREGWEMVRNRYVYPGFREFIERVLDEHGDPDSNINAAFNSAEHYRNANARWSLFWPRQL